MSGRAVGARPPAAAGGGLRPPHLAAARGLPPCPPRHCGRHHPRDQQQLVASTSGTAEPATAAAAEAPRDSDGWRAAAARLQALGLDAEAADKALAKAYGWGPQAYWRLDDAWPGPSAPTAEGVGARLEFLASVGVSAPEDVAKLVSAFPEALALEVELMRRNVDKLSGAFFLSGAALANALKRKPRALGAVVDCEGTCAGFCTRCFAQF